MKKYTIVIVLMLCTIIGFSQSTVYTCENNPVYATLRDELQDIQAANNQFLQIYGPMFGFTQDNIIDDASNTYNCHAYAYHVSEGGNKVWINNVTSSAFCDAPLSYNIDQYWEDACIIQVASESDAEKVHYYRGDHSAIRLSNGMYQSKWGQYPLVRHAAADVDYCDSYVSRRYYSSFKVDALNNYVCYGNNLTLFTPDYVNCTFNWTYNTNLLNYVSGQGTKSFTVTPKYSSTSGLAWVTLTLTIGSPINETRSITKQIAVNMPHYDDLELALCTSGGSPVSYMCPDTHYHIYLNNSGGCSLSNYDWSIPAGWTENYTWNNMVSVYTGSTPGGMVEVYADACNGVNSKVVIDYFGSGYCGGMYSLVLSPNPTIGETTLSIETITEDTEFDEKAEWQLEVFDQLQMLKAKNTKLKGQEYKINTAGWKEGVYFVRVKYKEEVLQEKLVVKS